MSVVNDSPLQAVPPALGPAFRDNGHRPLAGVLFRSALVMLLAVALPLIGGCRLSYKVPVSRTGAPEYDHLQIVYDIQGNCGALASRTFQQMAAQSDQPVQQVGQTAAFSRATLRIEYPHPDGAEGLVRATLRLTHEARADDSEPASWTEAFRKGLQWMTIGGQTEQSDSTAGSEDEVWVLDFPKQQLDLVLVDLADTGFFDEKQHREGGTRLSVTIDRGQTAKTWTSEPRLDDLMARVYREGWLLGFLPREESGAAGVRTVGWTKHDAAIVRHARR